jgi:glycosyltransferase involved in cell wall biosynthesis
LDKIKILFVSNSGYPSPNVGGSNKIIYEVLRHLDYSRYKTSFFSYDLKADYALSDELNIDQRVRVSLKRRTGKKMYESFFPYRKITSSILYLKYYFRKRDKYFFKHQKYFESFNVIHAHDSLPGYFFKGLVKPKKILTIHSKGSVVSEMKENLPKTQFYKKLLDDFEGKEKLAFDNADVVTFPSKVARDMFLSDLRIGSEALEKTTIIHNGIDINYVDQIESRDIFYRYNIDEGIYDLILLNVAAHIKPKNIDLILAAVKMLKVDYGRKVLFINAGIGYLTEQLKSITKDLDLNENVKLLGPIPNEDIIRFMKKCDIFIMPSERVVYDIVILEALACGIPVIASNEEGNKEIINNEVNGLLLEYLTPSEIVNKVLICLSNPLPPKSKQIKFGNSIEHMMDKYKEIYET